MNWGRGLSTHSCRSLRASKTYSARPPIRKICRNNLKLSMPKTKLFRSKWRQHGRLSPLRWTPGTTSWQILLWELQINPQLTPSCTRHTARRLGTDVEQKNYKMCTAIECRWLDKVVTLKSSVTLLRMYFKRTTDRSKLKWASKTLKLSLHVSL